MIERHKRLLGILGQEWPSLQHTNRFDGCPFVQQRPVHVQ